MFAGLASLLFYGFTFVMDCSDPAELEALLKVPVFADVRKFFESIFGGGWSAFIGAL